MYQVDSRPRDSMSADEDDEEDEKDFNPACVQFTDDELKPTPLQRKSRKILVKAEDKDDRYWAKVCHHNYYTIAAILPFSANHVIVSALKRVL